MSLIQSARMNGHDLSRGIYQCFKYRAVCIAWQRALDAHAVLVIQEISPLNSLSWQNASRLT